MKIVTILGSASANSNTRKALAVVEEKLAEIGVEVSVIDPLKIDLSHPAVADTEDTESITALVKEADAVILATPEYHGSYSSVIKQIIDNLGYPSALCGNAVGLLGVAASPFGAIKALEHLSSITTHLGCHALPKMVNVASVYSVFDQTGKLTDEGLRERLEALAVNLVEYAKKFN
jgi:FMN reductase